jgi:hypothetical protein
VHLTTDGQSRHQKSEHPDCKDVTTRSSIASWAFVQQRSEPASYQLLLKEDAALSLMVAETRACPECQWLSDRFA